MSKRRGKKREAKQATPPRASSKPGGAAKPTKRPKKAPTTRRPRSGIPSAIAWFAIGGLLTLGSALRWSWPWAAIPNVGSTVNWPDYQQVFPEFRAVLLVLLSTSTVFFLLVPLANWAVPRRVLSRTWTDRAGRPTAESTGYWLMWVAVAVFAATYFVPGSTVAIARPAQPAGTVFWRAATGNAAVICWLSAVVLVWLAAVLASAGRLGQWFDRTSTIEPSPRPPQTWGVAAAACVQLLLYPFLTAVACGWWLDLWCGSEVFVPAGTMADGGRASTGGGPTQLWLILFALVAWPTVVVCCLPVVGLIATAFQPKSQPPKETDQTADVPGTTPAGNGANEDRRVANPPPWTTRALLVATCSFVTGVLLTVFATRLGSPAGYPGLSAMGLSWWTAVTGTLAICVSGICLRQAVIVRKDPAPAKSRAWIAGATLLAIVCGVSAAAQLWSLAQRGLNPATADRLIYAQADLNYASAVRLRLQEIRGRLDTRAANEGILSTDDQALRDLCDRLLTGLIGPTETAAVERDDLAPIAHLAAVITTPSGPPPGKTVFDGGQTELIELIGKMRERQPDLRLPQVVAGGRQWVGVRYLLNFVLLGYLAALLSCLGYVLATQRDLTRSNRLRGLAPFWYVGAVFCVFWLAAG